jgi:hypothetical protein
MLANYGLDLAKGRILAVAQCPTGVEFQRNSDSLDFQFRFRTEKCITLHPSPVKKH